MKKWFSLLFVLLLVFSMTAIAEETYVQTSPGKLVGTWYADTAVTGKTTYRPTGDVRLEINRDKTAVFVHNDITHTFTWELSSDNAKLNLKLDNREAMQFNPHGGMNEAGKLVIQALEDGTPSTLGMAMLDYTFTKENNTTVLPAAVPVEEEDSLFGTYTALYSMAGTNAQLLADGEVTLRVDFAEIELTMLGKSHLYVTDFVDGTLKVKMNSGILLTKLQDLNKYTNLTLSATDDPSMIVGVVTDDEGNVGETYYFAKNIETAE